MSQSEEDQFEIIMKYEDITVNFFSGQVPVDLIAKYGIILNPSDIKDVVIINQHHLIHSTCQHKNDLVVLISQEKLAVMIHHNEHIVNDMFNGNTLHHIKKINPMLIKSVVDYYKNIGDRRGIYHILNQSNGNFADKTIGSMIVAYENGAI